MPFGPIVDTHVPLWDPRLIRHPWLDTNALLNRAHLLNDYCAATADVSIESLIFVQCEADFSAFAVEAAWITELAEVEPRIKGVVAWAPLKRAEP